MNQRLNLRFTAKLSAIYLLFAFGFSLVGFVARQPTVHFHEYTFPEAVLEIGGHFIWGAMAAAPSLSMKKSILCGTFALGIDADHVLGALNLNVSGRPDHSVSFIIFATMLILWLSVRWSPKISIRNSLGFAILVPVSVLAHISYDVFAAYVVFQNAGFSFPLFVPFSFDLISLSYWTWAFLEVTAFGISIYSRFAIVPRQPRKSTKLTT